MPSQFQNDGLSTDATGEKDRALGVDAASDDYVPRVHSLLKAASKLGHNASVVSGSTGTKNS